MNKVIIDGNNLSIDEVYAIAHQEHKIGNKKYGELVKDFNYLKDFEPFVYSVHTFNRK
ncbi:hypothetical protein ACRRVA_01130 [Candidatus Cardinium hertigii]|uniref:hypothetical protein n=1 Tax=Candidatus Cardinium hertigii TaxID=247481 RepID=UPI003D7C90BE